MADYVQDEVTREVSDRLRYDLDDIRDVRYENDRLVFDFVDPSRQQPEANVEGEPVMEQFPPDQAERFVDAFRRVKGGE